MCSSWVIDFGVWFSGMTSNAVGTVVAALLAYYVGARYALPVVDSWRAARSVHIEVPLMSVPSFRRPITVHNFSSRSLVPVAALWVDDRGQLHDEDIRLRVRPDDQAVAYVGPNEPPGLMSAIHAGTAQQLLANWTGPRVVRMRVVFGVSGTDRMFQREIRGHLIGRLRPYYETRWGAWGRWEFVRELGRRIGWWARWRLLRQARAVAVVAVVLLLLQRG